MAYLVSPLRPVSLLEFRHNKWRTESSLYSQTLPLSFPEFAFLVLIITTPVAERLPYKVEAAAALKTEILSISSGEKALYRHQSAS